MQTFTGTVSSMKMNKTVAVAIVYPYRHPKYGKILKRITKLLAHNEREGIKEGDKVKIGKTRPWSKNVHFQIL